MRYEAVSVYDMSEVMGTLVTDDNGVVISFEPAEDSREDLFDEEIESGETIQRVAGHWRMTAFLDEDGTPVSSLPLSGDDEGD